MLFDIDHFKEVNDTFGHNIGDDVLRHLVAAWRHRLRRSDVLVRTGGDEFVVLLGDADPANAQAVAADLVTLADEAILTVTGVASSVSAGMALFRPTRTPMGCCAGPTKPSTSPSAPAVAASSSIGQTRAPDPTGSRRVGPATTKGVPSNQGDRA